MAVINLRDYYPFCNDCIVAVPDDVAEVLREAKRREESYIRQLRRNRAYYQLDIHSEEHLRFALTAGADKVCEEKWLAEQVHTALAALPDKQRQRIFAHYFEGISKAEIARAEGVDESAVRRSIERGLAMLKKIIFD